MFFFSSLFVPLSTHANTQCLPPSNDSMMLSSTLHSRPSQGLLRLITLFLFTLSTPTLSFLQTLVHFQPRTHRSSTFVYSPPVSTLFLSLTSPMLSTWSTSPTVMLFSSTWLLFSFSAVQVEGFIPSGAGNGPPGPIIDTSVPPPIPPMTRPGGKKTSAKVQPSNSVAPLDANPPPLSTSTTMGPVAPQPSGSRGNNSAGLLAPPIPTLAQVTGTSYIVAGVL